MSTKILRSAKAERDAGRELTIVKEFRFIGWTLGILLMAIVALVLVEAVVFGHEGLITDIKNAISNTKMALAFIFATSSGLSFGIAAIIKENPMKKKDAFKDFIISMAILEFIAVFAIAWVYPIPW